MMVSEKKILWTPTTAFIEDSNLRKYEEWLGEHKGLSFHDHNHLWRWSIENISDFWESIWQYFDIKDHGNYEKVLSNLNMPGTEWFSGSMINYAEHIFRNKTDLHPALIFQNEKTCIKLSWNDLEDRVYSVQQHLLSAGIKKGDCIAGYIPNIPEAIICFLAANSIGAVWSCCSPDFGVETVVERLAQIKPKILIATDGYQYNNKPYDKTSAIDHILDKIDSIESLIYVPYLNVNSDKADSISIHSIYETYPRNVDLKFSPVPFNHPIWVLYSSGTTGKPKAITHSHGGVLLEHLKYLSLHNDVKRGENFFWFSTTGWMMWNFLQATMLVGGIPVLYDGSPGYPSLEILWEMAEKLPIHHFGTSAPFLTACMQNKLELRKNHNLSALRSIGSTGSPLPPEAFEYIYNHISPDVWLCSMSGGTDVCTAFVGGHPYKRVEKGLIQSRALGCALKAYNDNGEEVIDQLGEMIIEKPMPSMPIYFWNDEGDKRYKESYFGEYPNKWRHGDWIKIYQDGALLIQGRSDSTLNRKGVRIGTAEIYNVLDKIEAIKDGLIINIELKDGSDKMPLFIVLNDKEKLTDELKSTINNTLKSYCSPRHVPDEIYEVNDIPYTLSGKKMEVPVKKLFMNLSNPSAINRDAMKNPTSMDDFVKIANGFSDI